ncbi:ABC transporter ATP-binding protein [Methylocella sp.]|uniref:ABC transporter ATP-binding protein n=1 Tax=Methylocella sp. TaxID=1978226 RepID=UPI00378451AC
MSAPLLELAGLTLRYGGLTAVDGIDLSVAPNALDALIGPNGAGKTSLFNLISGYVRPSAGGVRFDGAAIESLSPARRARLGLGRTFQNLRLFSEASALETVLIGMHARLRASLPEILARVGRFRHEEREAIEEARALLAFVGLAGRESARAGALSYGDRRRLEIARALALRPKLLLLDEPAAGMNPAETDRLRTLLEAVRARGIALLLVEHDMNLVMRLAEKITVVNFGRRIFVGPPQDARRDRAVLEAYLGAGAGRDEGARGR